MFDLIDQYLCRTFTIECIMFFLIIPIIHSIFSKDNHYLSRILVFGVSCFLLFSLFMTLTTTIECNNCHKLIYSNNHYCNYCGTKNLEREIIKCQNCGKENPKKNNYCADCGEKLK